MATSTKIEITAVDKTQRAFSSVKTSLSSVDKAASQVKGSLGGLQTAVGALAGVAGFGALVSTFRDVGDRLGKVSSQLNITTEALQGLRFAAEQSGVSNSQLDTALQRLNRRLGDFVTTGGGPAAAAFERLGIATTDSTGAVRRADEVFFDVADAISNIESPAEKASLAFKFFDRAGADLLVMLNSGRSGLEDYRKQLIENGAVIEEEAIRNTEAFNDAMNLLERSIRGKVVNALAGPLKTALETVNENFGLVTTAVGALTVALIAAAAPAAIGAVVTGITNIIGVMSTLQVLMLTNPLTAIATGLAALSAWFISSNWDAVSGGFDEMKTQITQLTGEAKVAKLKQLTEKLDSLNEALKTQKLAEQSALGAAGKKARQEQIATLETQISQTQELIDLISKRKKTETQTTQATQSTASATYEITQEMQKLYTSQLDAAFALNSQKEATYEITQEMQDLYTSQLDAAFAAKDHYKITQEMQNLYTSQLDTAFAQAKANKELISQDEERTALAKGLFLTNMEQGKYTQQEAFALASQLGLVNEMVALQQVLNDRAAEAYTKKVMEAEIEADLDFFLMERSAKQGTLNDLTEYLNDLLDVQIKKQYKLASTIVSGIRSAGPQASRFLDAIGLQVKQVGKEIEIAFNTNPAIFIAKMALSSKKVSSTIEKMFETVGGAIDGILGGVDDSTEDVRISLEDIQRVVNQLKVTNEDLFAVIQNFSDQETKFLQLERDREQALKDANEVQDSYAIYLANSNLQLGKVAYSLSLMRTATDAFTASAQTFLDAVATEGFSNLQKQIFQQLKNFSDSVLTSYNEAASAISQTISSLTSQIQVRQGVIATAAAAGEAGGAIKAAASEKEKQTGFFLSMYGQTFMTEYGRKYYQAIAKEYNKNADLMAQLTGEQVAIVKKLISGQFLASNELGTLGKLMGNVNDIVGKMTDELPGLNNALEEARGSISSNDELLKKATKGLQLIIQDIFKTEYEAGASLETLKTEAEVLGKRFSDAGLNLSDLLKYIDTLPSVTVGAQAAMGGLISGPLHTNGGVKSYAPGGPIELEGGEYIMRRDSVRKYGQQFMDAINQGQWPGMSGNTIEVNIYDGTGQKISEYDSALRVEIKERAARNSQFAAVA